MNLPQVFTSLASGVITTIAGVGYRDGIPAREADAGWPMGVVRRCDGDLIVVDYWGNRIWRIDPEGILHRFAGTGIRGNSGDGGAALDAQFFCPHDLCQDRHGNLYLSDLGNHTIRRIDSMTGVITRVAGSGRKGRGGDRGLAVEAELDCTCGVAVDDVGLVSDVRFPPERGHLGRGCNTSAFDPKKTFVGLYGSATTYNRRAVKTTSMIALLLGLTVVSVLVVWQRKAMRPSRGG